MEIIAHHAHVFQENVRYDGCLDSLKTVLEKCEIDKAVCFSPFSYNFRDDGMNVSPNKWLAEKLKSESRFYAFGTVDFTKNNIEDQVDEIYALGFKGIKMHPAAQKFCLTDEKAFRVYKKASEYHLPISFHTGIHWHRIADYNMLLYDEVLHEFPDLTICMEHVGGYHFFNEAVAVMNNRRERVYAGLTSVFDRDMNRFWYLGREKVKDLIWLTGIDQSVFGLDFPYNNAERIMQAKNEMIACINELGLGSEEKEKVLGKNLLKMMDVK